MDVRPPAALARPSARSSYMPWATATSRISPAGARRLVGVAWPPRTLELADHSAKRLFDTLPIHISMRRLDEEVVYGAVRFRVIAVSQEMERRLAAADLARQLLA